MRWLRTQFPTFKKLLARWRDNLTFTGKVLCGLLVLCFPALAAFDSPLFLLFSALFSVLLLAWIMGNWFRPRLMVRMIAPAETMRGEPVDLVIRITNGAPRFAPGLSVELADVPATWECLTESQHVGQLPGGKSTRAVFTVRPTSRGLFPLPKVQVTVTFPLGIFRFHTLHPTRNTLVVLPTYQPLAEFNLSRVTAQRAGERQSTMAAMGHGGEYFSSREYVPGMPVRRWDHSSSARLGQLVVREFTDPQHLSAAIVADTCSIPSSRDADAELEATVSLTAALSEALTEADYQVASLATSDGIQDLTQHGPTSQHDVVLRALAMLDATGTELFSAATDGIHSVGGIVFILIRRWDAAGDELCHRVALDGGTVRRIFIGDAAAVGVRPMEGDVIISIEEIESGIARIG